MAKDPAFLMYSSDFLTGTMFLSDEQVGKYIRLLCAQHQQGHLSEEHMLNICKSYDKHIFSKFEKDSDGNYFNERLELEIVKRRKYSESRSKNRLGKKKTCKSYDKHMEDENKDKDKDKDDNKEENEVEILDPYPFSEFWDLYDKKRGKKSKLKDKWDVLPEKTRKEIMEYIPLYRQSEPRKKFRKDPQTFLNNESWKDEIINNQNEEPKIDPFEKSEEALDKLDFSSLVREDGDS